MNRLKEMPAAYIKHVQGVRLRTTYFYGEDSLEVVIARFHDSLEDGELTKDELPEAIHEFYPCLQPVMIEALVESVVAITRRKGEVYMDYIKRLAKDPLARRVKIIDLKYNLYDCETPPPGDLKQRYKRALAFLNSKISWWSGTEHE